MVPGAKWIEQAKSIKFAGKEHNASATQKSLFREGLPWGLAAIHTDEAQKYSTGQGAKIMVIDSGVDRDHPDLRHKIVKAKDFLGTALSPYHPYPEHDMSGHGTHVAAKAVGEWMGVAPGADLYVARVCEFLCLDSRAIFAALNWAIEERVDVLNMSISSSSIPENIANHAFTKIEEANITVVASAGNRGLKKNSKIRVPGNISTVLTVGAIDSYGRVADFSSRGPELDLYAPGVNILSASLTKGINKGDQLMTLKDGTSMATPHVTGTVALIKSLKPSLTPYEVRKIVVESSQGPPRVAILDSLQAVKDTLRK